MPEVPHRSASQRGRSTDPIGSSKTPTVGPQGTRDGVDTPRAREPEDPSVVALVQHAGGRAGAYNQRALENGGRGPMVAALEAQTLHLEKGLVVSCDVLVRLLWEALPLASRHIGQRAIREFLEGLDVLPPDVTPELLVRPPNGVVGLQGARQLLEFLYRQTAERTKQEQISAAGRVLLRAEQLSLLKKFSLSWSQLDLQKKCDVLRCWRVWGRTGAEVAQRAVALAALVEGFKQGKRVSDFVRMPGATVESIRSWYTDLQKSAVELSNALGQEAAVKELRLTPDVLAALVDRDQQMVIAHCALGLTHDTGRLLNKSQEGFEAWMVESLVNQREPRVSQKSAWIIGLLARGADEGDIRNQVGLSRNALANHIEEATSTVSRVLAERFPNGIPEKVSAPDLGSVAARVGLPPSSVKCLLARAGHLVDVANGEVIALLADGLSEAAAAEQLQISVGEVRTKLQEATAELDDWWKARFSEGIPKTVLPEVLAVIAESLDSRSPADVAFLLERARRRAEPARVVALLASGMSLAATADQIHISVEEARKRVLDAAAEVNRWLKARSLGETPESTEPGLLEVIAERAGLQSSTAAQSWLNQAVRTAMRALIVSRVAGGMSLTEAAERLEITGHQAKKIWLEAVAGVTSWLKAHFPEGKPESISPEILTAIAESVDLQTPTDVEFLIERTNRHAARAGVVALAANGSSLSAVRKELGISWQKANEHILEAKAEVSSWLKENFPGGTPKEISAEVLAVIAEETGLQSSSEVTFLLNWQTPRAAVSAVDAVRLLANGLTEAAAAEQLGVSRHEVKKSIREAVEQALSGRFRQGIPEQIPPAVLEEIVADLGLESLDHARFLLELANRRKKEVTAAEVVALVAGGLSQKDAGGQLGISGPTANRRIQDAAIEVSARLTAEFPGTIPTSISVEVLRRIAADTNFSESSVAYLLENGSPKVTVEGVKSARPVLSAKTVDAVTLASLGMHLSDVGEQLGISKDMARKHLKSATDALLSRHFPEGIPEEISPDTLTAAVEDLGLASPSQVQFLLGRAPRQVITAGEVVALWVHGGSLKNVGLQLGLSTSQTHRYVTKAKAEVDDWLNERYPKGIPEEIPAEVLAQVVQKTSLQSSSDVELLLERTKTKVVTVADVVSLLARGLSLRRAGEQLGVDKKTVQSRLQEALVAVNDWLEAHDSDGTPEEMPPEILAEIAKDVKLNSPEDVNFLLRRPRSRG